jgi:hypothetical protein
MSKSVKRARLPLAWSNLTGKRARFTDFDIDSPTPPYTGNEHDLPWCWTMQVPQFLVLEATRVCGRVDIVSFQKGRKNEVEIRDAVRRPPCYYGSTKTML